MAREPHQRASKTVSPKELVVSEAMEHFEPLCEKVSPVHAGNTFLNDAFYLFEHVGVFLINPVGQVAAVIQDLVENKRPMSII